MGRKSKKESILRALGRRLVIVDFENIYGGAVAELVDAKWARALIEEAFPLRSNDHVVIGTCHLSLLNTRLVWGNSPRYLEPRSGPNGADIKLLEVLTDEGVADRFTEVVVIFGDGCFLEAIAQLRWRKVDVTVVARKGRCARSLQKFADHLVLIDGDRAERDESGRAA